MTAPMIQKIGTKMPKKNIHPCPFLSVMTPRVISNTRYSKPPKPMPHHMISPDCRFLEASIRGRASLLGEGADAAESECVVDESAGPAGRRSVAKAVLGAHRCEPPL